MAEIVPLVAVIGVHQVGPGGRGQVGFVLQLHRLPWGRAHDEFNVAERSPITFHFVSYLFPLRRKYSLLLRLFQLPKCKRCSAKSSPARIGLRCA